MDVPSRSLWRVTLVQVFRVVADVAKPWAWFLFGVCLYALPWLQNLSCESVVDWEFASWLGYREVCRQQLEDQPVVSSVVLTDVENKLELPGQSVLM